jgi:hypothetical protein
MASRAGNIFSKFKRSRAMMRPKSSCPHSIVAPIIQEPILGMTFPNIFVFSNTVAGS